MLRRLLTSLLLCCASSACTNGKSHAPCDTAVCPVGQACRADGSCRPVSSPNADAAASGEPDAQLATNEITTPDAAAPSADAGLAPAPAYQIHAASIGLADAPAPGLHMLDQRLDGLPRTCAAVSGKQLCLQGGLGP